jgi:glucose-1-phosphate thymidylyltransferase
LDFTDLNRFYLEIGELQVKLLGRGMVWLDAGTPESFLEAANFVASIEGRQGSKVACLEEIALRMGFLDGDVVMKLLEPYANSDYVRYVQSVADQLK